MSGLKIFSYIKNQICGNSFVLKKRRMLAMVLIQKIIAFKKETTTKNKSKKDWCP
jgi:hypothetical protein